MIYYYFIFIGFRLAHAQDAMWLMQECIVISLIEIALISVRIASCYQNIVCVQNEPTILTVVGMKAVIVKMRKLKSKKSKYSTLSFFPDLCSDMFISIAIWVDRCAMKNSSVTMQLLGWLIIKFPFSLLLAIKKMFSWLSWREEMTFVCRIQFKT